VKVGPKLLKKIPCKYVRYLKFIADVKGNHALKTIQYSLVFTAGKGRKVCCLLFNPLFAAIAMSFGPICCLCALFDGVLDGGW
jgi:hypothetical protein